MNNAARTLRSDTRTLARRGNGGYLSSLVRRRDRVRFARGSLLNRILSVRVKHSFLESNLRGILFSSLLICVL